MESDKYNELFASSIEEIRDGKIFLNFSDIEFLRDTYNYFKLITIITMLVVVLSYVLSWKNPLEDIRGTATLLFVSFVPFLNILMLAFFITGLLLKFPLIENINSIIFFFIVSAIIFLPFIKILNRYDDLSYHSKISKLYYELAEKEGAYRALKKTVLSLDSLSRYIVYEHLKKMLYKHIDLIRNGNLNYKIDIEKLIELRKNLKKELDVEYNINILYYKLYKIFLEIFVSSKN